MLNFETGYVKLHIFPKLEENRLKELAETWLKRTDNIDTLQRTTYQFLTDFRMFLKYMTDKKKNSVNFTVHFVITDNCLRPIARPYVIDMPTAR